MNSKPFLQQLAQQVYNDHQGHMDEVVLVFPNRRAGLFFRKYLAEYLDQPIWSPTVMSMEDFVGQYSELRVADKFTLIIDLYRAYCKQMPGDETFDKFYYWGEMLLKDFDDIDKYLINPEHLFINLSKQKELDDTFDFLTTEQKEIILTFWANFDASESKEKADFQKLWDKLYNIYNLFVKSLRDNNRAYTGILYKDLASDLSLIENMDKLVFAGFNALTTSEERIITHCVENGAQVYWDVDGYYLNDERQEAGEFFREYRSKTILGKSFPKEIANNINDRAANRNITLNAASLDVGQVKMLGNHLEEHVKNGLEPEKTVIVLPSEHMLFPVLNSVPDEVKALNVTMGFPLHNTPLYGLLQSLIELQRSAQLRENQLYFYFKPMLQVVQHPLISQQYQEEARQWMEKIELRNQSKVAIEGTDRLTELLFKKVETSEELLEYLKNVISTLYQDDEESLSALEKEYAFHFYTQLNRVGEVLSAEKLDMNLDSFSKLFNQMITNQRIPFSGEPLRGMQIMGVLETRNLDFDNVYILSMNEGMMPAAGNQHSFVPYNLRKAYGLPTYDQQDAMYSYLFYRLIQKAKNVHLYYNTVEEKGGELSRFVRQFMMETNHTIKKNTWSPAATLFQSNEITISKDTEVLENLSRYLVHGQEEQKRLTPSALNIYLDCRLKFYYRYVAEIYEYDTIQTDIDPMVFGNILHHTMENLYQPYQGKVVTPDHKAELNSNLPSTIDQAFAEHYFLEEGQQVVYEGKKVIARDIIAKYARKIIELDMAYAPLQIVGLEEKEKYTLDVMTDHGTVGLKGIIDRIDEKDGLVRVIDYKTGQDNKVIASWESLFDREDDKRNKAAMQTMLYALLYAEQNSEVTTLVPGIFNTKEMFSDGFDYHLSLQGEKSNQKTPIYNAMPYLVGYRDRLTQLLSEVFDKNVPFDQTDDLKKCSYCAYKEICGR